MYSNRILNNWNDKFTSLILRWKYDCLFKKILSTKNKNRYNCINKKNLINLIHAHNSIGLLCIETRFENVYSGWIQL